MRSTFSSCCFHDQVRLAKAQSCKRVSAIDLLFVDGVQVKAALKEMLHGCCNPSGAECRFEGTMN